MPEPPPWRDAPFWEAPGHRPALTAGHTLSVAELANRVGRAAAGLRAEGLVPGDRLVLLGTSPVETIELALSGACAGAVVVPVPKSTASSPEVAALLAHPRTRVVVEAGSPMPAGDPTVPLDGDAAGLVVDLRGAAAAPVDARPLSVRAAATASTVFPDVLGVPRGATVLVVLPHLHAFSLQLVTALLHARCHVVLPDTPTADGVRDALAARQCDVLVTTAQALAALLHGSFDGSGVRRVVSLGTSSGVRERLARATGDDVLVEYYQDDGIETLHTPPGSSLAGFWSRTAAGGSRLRAEVERRAAGLSTADPWAAVLTDSADVLVATLAASYAGVSLLVVPPAGDVDHLVRTSGAQAVVRSVGDIPRGAPVTPRRAGGVIPHTSGTTGAPKIVVRARRHVSPALDAAQSRALAIRFGLAGAGRHLVTLPLYQPAALYFALLALHGGQDLVLMETWSPRAALGKLRDDAITTAFMVPSMFTSLLSLPGAREEESFPLLRAVVHATAACPVDVKRAMVDWWGPVLYECYSPTEALGTYSLPDEWLDRPGTVGKALPGGEVMVLDEAGRDCGPGAEGYVFLRDSGFSYADGSEPFARDRGLVAVGDVGFLDEDGWLYLTGRMSDYISVGGSKFHPAAVEDVLATVEGVAECALTAVPDARLGQVPVALVVPAPGMAPKELRAAVLAHARSELPRDRVPLKVVLTRSLPRDGYGKLRRRELPGLVSPQKQ